MAMNDPSNYKSNTMRKLIISLLTLICLSGCHVYQPNIQQGNIVTNDMISRLKIGMDQNQVNQSLGTPALEDIFNDNHWAYTYTFQRSGGKINKQRLDLYFSNGKLVKIDNHYQPLY